MAGQNGSTRPEGVRLSMAGWSRRIVRFSIWICFIECSRASPNTRKLRAARSLGVPFQTGLDNHRSGGLDFGHADPVASSRPIGLRITVLGSFSVGVGAELVPADAWRRRKPAALIKILALAPGHRVHRDQLMDLLWPDLDLAAGGANLRKAIHQARSALDAVSRGASRLIEFQGDLVSLAPDQLLVDLVSFRSALLAARQSGNRERYQAALTSYGGDLLPEDLYEEWASTARREVHEEYVAALSECCALLESDGDIEGAIQTGRLLVAAEPNREESHAFLMRLYGLAGRRADALRQYDRLSEVLDHELGVEPSARVQRLREEINARRSEEQELNSELWERVGDLRVLAGDGAGAARAFAQALDAERDGSRRPAGDTARVERKCAEAWLMQHRPDEAANHLEAAQRDLVDRAESGRLFRARANLAWETGQIPAARHLAEQARDIAVECGSPDDLAAAREAVAIVSHFEGEWREGLESELERLAASEADGELSRVFDIHHCIGQYHLYGDGLFESVEGYARQILDRAEEVGAVRAQAFAWCLLGESLLLQARWDESDGCLERSCLVHDSLGSRSGALPWQRRAELAVCRHRFDEVDAYLRRASGIATVSAMASHLWGRIHATAALAAVERGDPAAAVHSVQAAAAASARYGDCPTCSALLNPVAAEAFASLGDVDNARYYGEAAAQVAGYFASSAWQGMAESAAGSVCLLEGDRVGARGHFEIASDLFTKAGQPFWADRSGRNVA
jgi:DNA-binding SARP family transcriptional activator